MYVKEKSIHDDNQSFAIKKTSHEKHIIRWNEVTSIIYIPICKTKPREGHVPQKIILL